MICIGCGCDEHHACTLPGGKSCAWVHVGPAGLAGICSACTNIFSALSIEPELEIAERAIAAAEADEEPGEYGYSMSVPIDQVDELFPPAISFIEPERPRLILPGDEDFHL